MLNIICSKKEFVAMVEACHDNRDNKNYSSCSSCIMRGLCTQDGEEDDEFSMNKISDVLQMEEKADA